MDQLAAEMNFIKIALGSFVDYKDPVQRENFLLSELSLISDDTLRKQLKGYVEWSKEELKQQLKEQTELLKEQQREKNLLQEKELKQIGSTASNLLGSDFRVSGIPTIDCASKLFGKGIVNINATLEEELGFKIPVVNPKYVQRFPEIFEFGDWEYSGSVLSWLEHNLVGSSEHSVVSLDSAWAGILQGFLPGLTLYRDQHDPSSLPYERPDVTVVYNNCIVLKAEAKLKELEMNDAEASLTEKFQGKAFQMFSRSAQSIIGVCTSESLAKIFKVSYNFELQKYESSLFPNAVYRVQHLESRVRFLVDMMKLMKWICTVNQPVQKFHLVPNVRTKTSNHHYITWNGSSIVKEFKRKDVDLQFIARIYEHPLSNVEFGEVLPTKTPTIRIDRIGRRLRDAIAHGFSKQTALQHVEEGIKQLHDLGLGHGDISVNNIFVDDTGVAFLDDLEYSAPLESVVPRERRPPQASNRMTMAEFDMWRFDQLKVEIAKL